LDCDNTETRLVRVIPTEVYSRVCGYFRPVSGWNIGKRIEFSERHFIPISEVEKVIPRLGSKVEK